MRRRKDSRRMPPREGEVVGPVLSRALMTFWVPPCLMKNEKAKSIRWERGLFFPSDWYVMLKILN